MDKQWLKLPEAAEYVGVSLATVYRWIKAGKLTLHKVGKVSRVKKEDVDRLLEGGAKE